MKHAAFLIAAAAACGAAAPAFAELKPNDQAGNPVTLADLKTDEPRYYVGLHGGMNQLTEWPAKVRLGAPVIVDGAAQLKRGYAAGLVIGRQREHTRVELEYQQGNFRLKGLELGAVAEPFAGEKGRYRALTLNGMLTGQITQRWNAYGGLGIGIGRVDLPAGAFSSGCDCFPKASGNGFVWLARLGTEYQFDWQGNHRAFLQYTWLNMRGPSTSGPTGIDYERKGFGALTVGYRYMFD